jgi:hypothetical protein
MYHIEVIRRCVDMESILAPIGNYYGTPHVYEIDGKFFFVLRIGMVMI